jgi:hypothetical protein
MLYLLHAAAEPPARMRSLRPSRLGSVAELAGVWWTPVDTIWRHVWQ